MPYQKSFEVAWAHLDAIGHMANTAYLDVVVDVRVGDSVVRVLAPAGMNVTIGERVGLRLDSSQLHFFEPASGERLN